MATFSDLMSLLMCFFVLLLSFSEMDVLKFKQIAGSMKFAFGVQNRLEVKDIPKGTSIIAQEFRPGRPEPTPIDVIMQQTIDITQQTVEFQEGDSDRAGGNQRDDGKVTGGQTADRTQNNETASASSASQQDSEQSSEQDSEELEELEQMIKKALQQEIDQGAVEVENLGQQLVIRIQEKGAFPEGSAFLQPKFRPLVRQVADLVKDIPGQVRVSGHTDNLPLDSELYRSSWDLSSQRAVSVAQEMEKVEGFSHLRLRVIGVADTEPLGPNDTERQRARNRRVEISIMQGEPVFTDEVSADDNG
jgi:chemotaxis protein MotB